jgi:hypothetical protein
VRTFSFYALDSGLLHQKAVQLDVSEAALAAAVAANCPAGHGALEGPFDHLSQKVDLAKFAADQQAQLDAHAATVANMREHFNPGMAAAIFREPSPPAFIATSAHVVDYQPPAPSADHEWNDATKRWQLSTAAAAAQQDRLAAGARIAELQASQHDLVRKMVLAPDEATRTQLAALDAEIDGVRAELAP